MDFILALVFIFLAWGFVSIGLRIIAKRYEVFKKWVPEKTSWFVDLALPLSVAFVFAVIISIL